MRKESSAGVVVYTDVMVDNVLKHKYLLLKTEKGRWDLPKGQMEENETKMQTALRELSEETGLTAKIIPGFEYIFSYMFRDSDKKLINKDVTFFLGKADHTNVKLSFEHASFQWLLLKEALQQSSYMNTRQLLITADHFLDSLDLQA